MLVSIYVGGIWLALYLKRICLGGGVRNTISKRYFVNNLVETILRAALANKGVVSDIMRQHTRIFLSYSYAMSTSR